MFTQISAPSGYSVEYCGGLFEVFSADDDGDADASVPLNVHYLFYSCMFDLSNRRIHPFPAGGGSLHPK